MSWVACVGKSVQVQPAHINRDAQRHRSSEMEAEGLVIEHHGIFSNIQKSFLKFIEQTKDKVIISKDCENIKKMDLEKYKVTIEDS